MDPSQWSRGPKEPSEFPGHTSEQIDCGAGRGGARARARESESERERERERERSTQIYTVMVFNTTNLPRVGGKFLELASLYQGRNRALDHGRVQGDETSGMVNHQLCNPWQRGREERVREREREREREKRVQTHSLQSLCHDNATIWTKTFR